MISAPTNNNNIEFIDLSIDDDEDHADVKKSSDVVGIPFGYLTPQSSLTQSEASSFSGMTAKDMYCWVCHLDGDIVNCTDCPRGYHLQCISMAALPIASWTCNECERLQLANKERRLLEKVTTQQFYMMLENVIKRLKYPGSEAFQVPMHISKFSDYKKQVIVPMDLSLIEQKIKNKRYFTTEEVLSEIKWMHHNSCVYNGVQSKVTATAKSILRMARHEINEMEVCPDCYLNSILKQDDNWFCEPCRSPHPLVWAKMKGFPFWPGKALRIVNGEVDVRFFGAHDRSWIQTSKCYWLSKSVPSVMRQRMNNLQPSLEELKLHIDRLNNRFGEFNYAPYRSVVDPEKPFVFILSLKDQCCLQVIVDNSANARKMYGQRNTNSDNESLCSSRINDKSPENASSTGQTNAPQQPEVRKKRKYTKREKKPIKEQEFHVKLESEAGIRESPRLKKTRLSQNASFNSNKNNVQTSPCKKPANISVASSSSNSSAVTATTKATISMSTRNDDDEQSFDDLSDVDSLKEYEGNGENRRKRNAACNDDAFEPAFVDAKDNSKIFKTLVNKSTVEDFVASNSGKKSPDIPVVDDLMSIVKRCKAALGINSLNVPENFGISTPVNNLKTEATETTVTQAQQSVNLHWKKNPEALKEMKKEIEDYKILFEEKNKKEMEIMKQDYDQLIKEIQYNADLKIKEVINEGVREKLKTQKKFEKLIDDTKRKQWCSNCFKEANYYCCWNTSYCDEDCQRHHWSSHMEHCMRDKDN